MKKFTLILLLMTAMFTTATAQEVVDLTTGTFGGEYGDKDTYSQWTSANGVKIVSTDGRGDTEIQTPAWSVQNIQLPLPRAMLFLK